MSNISAVNATLGMTPSSASQSANPSQTLNQADFLQLLVTQMTSQDPLSPVSDTDMAAQMAQFSALQAAQSTDSDVKVLQANTLIGRTVTVSSSTGAPVTGAVTGIEIQSGAPEVVISGQMYSLSQISAITPAATSSTTAAGSSSTTPASGSTTTPTTPTPGGTSGSPTYISPTTPASSN